MMSNGAKLHRYQYVKQTSQFLPFLLDFSSFFPIFLIFSFFPDFGKFFAVKGGTLPPLPPQWLRHCLQTPQECSQVCEELVGLTYSSQPVEAFVKQSHEQYMICEQFVDFANSKPFVRLVADLCETPHYTCRSAVVFATLKDDSLWLIY